MDEGAWWATVHEVAWSRTRLKQLSAHTQRSFSDIICRSLVTNSAGSNLATYRQRHLRLNEEPPLCMATTPGSVCFALGP